MAINTDKLNEFLGRFVADLGATFAAGNVVIGHQLGLYRALAASPAAADELAARTQTSPRYIAERLRGQAAGGYVEYDPATSTYSTTEEQVFALANPDGGVYVPGAFVLALGTLKAEPRITEAAGRRARQAPGRRQGRQRRLRARRLDHPARPGISELGLRRLGLPRPVDRARPQAGRRRRSRRPGQVRSGAGSGLLRIGLRPGSHVRLPA